MLEIEISINMYIGSTRIFERHSHGGVGTAEYSGGTGARHVRRGDAVKGGSGKKMKGRRTVRQGCAGMPGNSEKKSGRERYL